MFPAQRRSEAQFLQCGWTVCSRCISSSRSRLSGLIEGAKVFVNGKLITSNGYQVKENDLISVRGMGKFRYIGTGGKTKKNRLSVEIEDISEQ